MVASDAEFASVAERLRAVLHELPAAERRIARVLLAQYPAAGLDTASRLAEQAGTSTPTVVRLAARLGFPRYRDFQQALRDELDDRHASPLTLPSVAGTDTPAALRALAAEVYATGMQRTLATIADADLDAVITLLTDQRLRITCLGGRFSHVLAEYLDLHLRLLRPGTRVLDLRADVVPAWLADVGRRDVLVVFDVRRYQADVVDLARRAHECGATLVVFTDPWLSPAAGVAEVVLPVRIEGPSPFDSLVPMAAVVETVVAGVLDRLGEAAEQRLRAVERLGPDVTLA